MYIFWYLGGVKHTPGSLPHLLLIHIDGTTIRLLLMFLLWLELTHGAEIRIKQSLRQQEVLLFLLLLCFHFPFYYTIKCLLQLKHKRDCIADPECFFNSDNMLHAS